MNIVDKYVNNIISQEEFIEYDPKIPFNNNILEHAAYRNDTQIIEWIINNYALDPDDYSESFNIACKNNNLETLKLIFVNVPDMPIYEKNFVSACKCGDLRVAKWLVSIKPNIINDYTQSNVLLLLIGGHWKAVCWLLYVTPNLIENATIIIPIFTFVTMALIKIMELF